MSEATGGDVRVMVEHITKAIVDTHDEVFIEVVEEGGDTVIEVEVAENEVGKLIGRNGRTAKALRTLLNAASMKHDKRYVLEIIE
jgi:predicted RNA-binding protein YlqC (UPF0109 family)